MRKQIIIAALFAATALGSPAFAQETEPRADGSRPARAERPFSGGERVVRENRGDWQRPQRAEAPTAPQAQVRDRSDRGQGGWRGERAQAPVAVPQAPTAQADGRGDGRRGGWQGNNSGQGNWRGSDANRQGGWRGNTNGNGWQGRPAPTTPPVAQVDPRRNDGWRGNNDARRGQGWRGDNDARSGDGRGWNGRDGNGDRRNDGWRGTNDGRHNGGWRGDDRGRGDAFRYGNRGNDAFRGGSWNRDWRRDQRYDWQRYRSYNRDFYRLPRYYAPYGYNYGYRRFSIGITLGSPFYAQQYWLDDPYDYRLPEAYPPYRWVRYYNDVLLIDTRSGYVVDVIYDFFY